MSDGPVVSQADARAWSSLTGIAQIIDCPPASVAALPEARRPAAVQCSGRLIRLAALVQRLAEVHRPLSWSCPGMSSSPCAATSSLPPLTSIRASHAQATTDATPNGRQ